MGRRVYVCTHQRDVPVAGVQDFKDHFYSLFLRGAFIVPVIHQCPGVDVRPSTSAEVLTLMGRQKLVASLQLSDGCVCDQVLNGSPSCAGREPKAQALGLPSPVLVVCRRN